ncbi:MAG: LysM peptidoglycan-binding domain-containing protein [Anaerolineaceae bacterium]|nr:LysM peptidoglycan-binding domain-containing protein [Anaerolineaceae bacterium]
MSTLESANPTNSSAGSIKTGTPLSPPSRIIPTLPPAPTTCPSPAGWQAYTLMTGDTFLALSETYAISPQEIKRQNCLIGDNLQAGTVIFLPPLPPVPSQTALQSATATLSFFPTPTRSSCGPPANWIRYIVQPEDTLFSIGLAYGIGVSQLQEANCLGSSTLIYAGQSIHVPNTPPRFTPTRSPTARPPTQSATPTPTATLDLTATAAVQQTAEAQQALTLTAEADNLATSQAQTATAQSIQATSQAQTATAIAQGQTEIAQTETAQAENP